MTLSPDDAAKALSEIEATETRSRAAYAYLIGGSYLILWGAIWVVCFSLVDFLPHEARNIWIGGSAVGIFGSVILGQRRRDRVHKGWRAFMPATGYVAFTFAALELITPPPSGEAVSAFVALVVSLAYVQIGAHFGDRITLIGIALAAMTIAGFLWIPVHFHLFLALIGGGSLVLAGLWLRRV
jgi:hypothetical protein